MKKINFFLLIPVGLLFLMFSCEEVILEKDISDKTVELVAPINNAQFNSTSVVFTWNEVQDATKYQLKIARPNFTNPLQIVLDTLITATSFNQQLAIGQYEWQVRAVNSGYNTSYSSRLLTIASNEDFQSNTMVLTAPTNNLITNTASQTLSWQAIIGATNYQVQVYDEANTIVLDQTTPNTTYNYIFADGTYQWRVRATNGTDYTLYSSRSVLIDTTVPNTPTLISPANTGNTTETDIVFQWNRTPITGSTENDKIYIYSNSALTNLVYEGQVTSPFTRTLSAGTYYWRVKALDTAGNEGAFSTTFSFTIN